MKNTRKLCQCVVESAVVLAMGIVLVIALVGVRVLALTHAKIIAVELVSIVVMLSAWMPAGSVLFL